MRSKLKQTLRLPYARRIVRKQDGDGAPYWVACIEEIDWCKTYGDTYWEALAMLNDCFIGCIKTMIEEGVDIPPPNRIKRASSYKVSGFSSDIVAEKEDELHHHHPNIEHKTRFATSTLRKKSYSSSGKTAAHKNAVYQHEMFK